MYEVKQEVLFVWSWNSYLRLFVTMWKCELTHKTKLIFKLRYPSIYNKCGLTWKAKKYIKRSFSSTIEKFAKFLLFNFIINEAFFFMLLYSSHKSVNNKMESGQQATINVRSNKIMRNIIFKLLVLALVYFISSTSFVNNFFLCFFFSLLMQK